MKKLYPNIIILILLGAITWSATMVKSGLRYSFGMGFWGPNGHDGVWHIAVIKGLARGSWEMPVFSGELLKNYHIGYDLLLAWIYKLTFIPVEIIYFQIMPSILALFTGILAYKFVYDWRRSKLQAFWATFFVYFGGSLGWAVTLIRTGGIGGESLFWSQQSISTLINPPFAFSIVLIFAGLILLQKGLKSNNKRQLTLVSFIFGILIQIKVYAGILALGGLFVAGIWRMVKREGITLMRVFSGAAIISVLLFFPLMGNAGSTVVFKPFWFLETMMRFSDRFNWPRFAEAMVNYRLAGNLIKGSTAYVAAFLIFIVGNFGTRLVKNVWIFKKIKDFKNMYFIDVFLLSMIGAGIIIPVFYIQRGTPWNTIQFMYYSLMFSGILAGITLGELLERKSFSARPGLAGMFIVFVVVLTIPTTIGTLQHYLPARPPAKLSYQELEALKFLAKQPEGVVLTYPFDKDAADAAINNPPRPLYLYESTAYVSAFSDKPIYLEDEVNLEITGYDWKARREKVERFFSADINDEAKSFVAENNISYIYLIRDQIPTMGSYQGNLEEIFVNDEVNIFRVN
jgi:hypothetical protein